MVADRETYQASAFLFLKIPSGTIIYFFFLPQEIEKSHNQNRKTKDGTADSNKGN